MQTAPGLSFGHLPSLDLLLNATLAQWPEHEKFLSRSFKDRSDAVLKTSDRVSAMICALEAGELPGLCADYHWMCDRLQESEIEFRRSGQYERTNFAEVHRDIYSNRDFMSRYIRGLLLSHVAWFNHASVIDFFIRDFLPAIPADGRVLDVGPGHGLMLCLASQLSGNPQLAAWDVSPASLDLTKAALATLGVQSSVEFALTDILRPIEAEKKFDAVILCEVLEHLEDPDRALANLRQVIGPGGRLFVSVPINSPAPDHIHLLRSPKDAEDLVARNGFRILQARHFATGGYSVERAERLAVTISSGIIAEPIGPQPA